ncbi:MAG TPA: RNA polymerase sigma factor [Terracidiphilus sp.]|nr:RNA polymerase sigma factor [Terracidiphilus sp.]
MTLSNRGLEAQFKSTLSGTEPDTALVAAAADGDVKSFEALVRRYRRTVVAVAYRITGSRDDAEDVAQQTFMKVFMNLSTFCGRSSFSTWLTSIAMNEARMWNRKASRRHEIRGINLDGEGEMAPSLEVSDLRPDAESVYLTGERTALLLTKMNELRPTTRIALELCELQEESTSRAAVLLGITVSAVKSRRSRGRAELRRALA